MANIPANDRQWQAALPTPSLFPHCCTISASLFDSPGDATPAGALSVAYTHTVAIVDRVNEYPDATNISATARFFHAELKRDRSEGFHDLCIHFCGLTSSNESTYYRFLDAEYGTHSSSATVKTNDGRLNAKGEASVTSFSCHLLYIRRCTASQHHGNDCTLMADFDVYGRSHLYEACAKSIHDQTSS